MDTYSPSYSINKTHIYHVSKHSSSHYGSLIDRGANGGLAGSDVRILERTGRTVSVTGLDIHELPGLDIVTCAALLHTNHGKMVLILHEYAYYGRGNTIHSPGQMTNPFMWEGNKLSTFFVTFLFKTPIAPCYCQMMG